MANEAHVHILEKANLTKQFCVNIPSDSLPPLAPSSIRAKTVVVSLTVNNLSYAKGGTLLRWWDTYPVPQDAPKPFNDSSSYGRVPAWGWAEVLESTISIAPGTIIWGYWPLSTLPTDLQLVPAPTTGHWIETSPHRKALMPYYNRYMIPMPDLRMEDLSPPEMRKMGLTSLVRGQWESAYLLNHFVLSPDSQTILPPSGTKNSWVAPSGLDKSWSDSNGDLSCTVIVSLAASSKTAKCFKYQLKYNRPHRGGPLGILSVSSKKNPNDEEIHHIGTKSATYGEIADPQTLKWIVSLKPKKVLIVDFGGRENAAGAIYDVLKASFSPSDITVLGVGSEAKITTAADIAEQRAMAEKINRIQLNASDVKEAAIVELGEERYHEQMSNAWRAWVVGGEKELGGLKLNWGEGITGENGVEGGWKKIVEGRMDPNVGLVYRI